MTRIVVTLFGLFMCFASAARASGEIGYVEDFSGHADRYVVRRGDMAIPIRLCLPLLNGDQIEALDDTGRVSLRLIDHPKAVIWSRADKYTRITAVAPQASFWSGLMDWTMASLSPLDDQKRERVLTTIRNDGGAKFGVPLLQVPQVMAAGKRALMIGWLKPSAVAEISVTAKSGQRLVDRSKATGGLWTSPLLNLKPGTYRIEVATAAATARGEVRIVDGTEMPVLPEELTRDSVPEPLRHTSQALWLAAQDGGRYQLEAMQLIAKDRTVRPAELLLEALIGGAKFSLPK